MTINAINRIPKKTDACPTMGDYAISKKMNVKWGNHKVGDIVLFDFNHNGTSDHIGIVTEVHSNYIKCVEGNTGSGSDTNGGEVQERTRYKSQVNFFIRPKYDSEVTAAMVVDTARGELGTKESPRNSNKVEYNRWYYGKNISAYWCCTFVCWVFAHVVVIKPIAKPTTKYSGSLPAPTLRKGAKSASVKLWQKFLNWFGKFGLKVDGDFGSKTYAATQVFQKTMGLDTDGVAGKLTIAAAKTFLAVVKTTTPVKTSTPKADKLVATVKKLAWAAGTPEKKWLFKTGNPTDACVSAMKKRGYGKTGKKKKNRLQFSDCGFVQNTCLYIAFGVKTKVLPSSAKKKFPEVAGMKVVFQGKKIPADFLKPGMIIRYPKTNGAQHAIMYLGNGYIAEGGRGIRFFIIRKDTQKYNKSNVKFSRLQVLQVKEAA